jgi:K+-transporting ATPase ATPase C chain
MRRQLFPALAMVIVFTVVCGLAYPLLVTGIAQGVVSDKADGSLVEQDGVVVGSELIGQPFAEPEYFHPRPSAAGDGYDGSASSGSNLGPTNPALVGECESVPVTDEEDNELTDDEGNPIYETKPDGSLVCDPNTIPQRIAAYREENGLDATAEVPVDAVTASGSGLDPHISVANARIQAVRVADERGLELDEVLALVDQYTEGRSLGFLGEEGTSRSTRSDADERVPPLIRTLSS